MLMIGNMTLASHSTRVTRPYNASNPGTIAVGSNLFNDDPLREITHS